MLYRNHSIQAVWFPVRITQQSLLLRMLERGVHSFCVFSV
ncbi:hypothetical protein VCRA2122O339_190001 [Vibrio crassostreae]|nr:hypothetical protein VCRA2122O339_190001 [Vibrio crassostreae]